ncbi:hypothetical protein GJ496_010154 [Pomphorhynchus laevis]|nr:hypothetical protein GJ496_010154 [Pomphorhynchus laevis]
MQLQSGNNQANEAQHTFESLDGKNPMSIWDVYKVVIQRYPRTMDLPQCEAIIAACNLFSTDPGASTCLSTLPLIHERYWLTLNEFRDSIATRYGWDPEGLSSNCMFNTSLSYQMDCRSVQHDWLKQYRKLMTKGKLRVATAVLEDDVFACTLKHDSSIDGVPIKEVLMSLHSEAIQPAVDILLYETMPSYCLHHTMALQVNSTVPIASEVLKHRKVYNPRKLFGVTTLDIVRANTFVSQLKNISVDKVQVPVVAGHSGDTIVPLLSQVVPKCSFTEKERDALVKRIQNAGTEVVNAKAGAGSATLSMAFAASRFVQSILKAKFGETGIVECALSEESDARQEPRFFSRPHLLGLNGIEKSLELGNISKAEETLLQKANEELSKNIKKGIEFGKNYCKQLN